MEKQKESKSMFIEINNTDSIQTDEGGRPCQGTRVFADDYDSEEKKITLLRFIDGKLNGDIFDDKGKLVEVKPAVETSGHMEYWRDNRLHRDNGEAAVISDGFSYREWWENGRRVDDK